MIIIMIGRSTSPGLHGYIHFGALYQRQNLCASHLSLAQADGGGGGEYPTFFGAGFWWGAGQVARSPRT